MKPVSTMMARKTAGFRVVLGIALVGLLLSACNFPTKNKTLTPAPTNDASSMLSSEMLAAHPCQTFTAPVEVEYADPAVPTPLFTTHKAAKGVINWMILGSDYRPDAGFRTDTIMLVSIDTTKRSVSVVSFPRDTYVTIPGWTTQRINTAMQHGGFSMLQDTLSYNFGVCPSGFVMTNFEGFKNIIDSLGGVDVDVAKPLSDACDLPKGASLASETGWCSIDAGVHHMDGVSALWFVRARHSTSDFERLKRAQEVTLAVFKKIASDPTSINLPDLFAKYKDSVQTNLTVADVLPLLPVAAKVVADPSQIKLYAIVPPLVHGFITSGGGDVQIPDLEGINKVLDEAIPSEP